MITQHSSYDAIVIGSGPNGLAAAITLAQAGRSVLVVEAKDTLGGGTRTAELTLPGFLHDVCSAILPLSLASPFFRALPLGDFGLEWIQPAAPVAHPLPDGSAVVLERSVQATGEGLGEDNQRYQRLMSPLVKDWKGLLEDILGPFPLLPKHPVVLSRFGWHAFRSAQGFANSYFSSERARALFAGLAGHAIMPLEKNVSASFGLVMGIMAHAIGWPVPKGGSQSVSKAMISYLQSLKGELITGWNVESLDELPPAKAILADVTPRQLLKIAGTRLPAGYRRQLERYRYGPGVFKLDIALDGPIPWKAEGCRRAGAVHVGGTLQEIAASEQAVWAGKSAERPFVLVAQQSLFDGSRAPAGKHTVWAYCHVPNGSTEDMTEKIEAQIERFAPGFRDCILARSVKSPARMEEYDANYVGGDINGGVQDIYQLWTRPVARWVPYSTPVKNLFLCSSSTPPGGGVHGMCGYYAAKAAQKVC